LAFSWNSEYGGSTFCQNVDEYLQNSRRHIPEEDILTVTAMIASDLAWTTVDCEGLRLTFKYMSIIQVYS
jgi:hypothetical protein